MKPEPKDPFLRAWARLQARYGALDPAARRRLWAGLALVSVIAGAIILLAGRTQWDVLYTGLQARDAGAITERLKAAKVPFRLTDGGGTIEVPEAAVYEQRLSLASQGLPQGQDRGYELLDENSLMVNEETAKVNRVRALQGELERTILGIDGVDGVRVHLVIPDRQAFGSAAEQSSASVLLKLHPGANWTDSEANSVALLVSHAVEGLKPDMVAIVDSEGRDLGPGTEGGPAQVGSHVEAARKVERHLHDQVQSLLDEALGAGAAIVRVHADLDFDGGTTTRDLYTPPTKQGGLVREESTGTSNSGSNGGGPTGTVASNGGAAVAGPTGAARGASSNDRRVVYELDHTVENVTQAAGRIQRISVAVLLERPLDAGQLAVLKQAVAETAGVDTTRGDDLSVAVAPPKPAQSAADATRDQALQKEATTQRRIALAALVAPWVLLLVGILSLTVLAWKLLRLILLPPAGGPTTAPAGTAGEAAHASIPRDVDLGSLVERDPASAAQVLRRMMNN